MEVAGGVPWSIFISVSVSMLAFVIAIGSIALINKATLANETKHINDKFIEIRIAAETKATEVKIDTEKIRAENKLDIEKIRADNKLDIEKIRTDHRLELDKIIDNKSRDSVFFAESLAKFNTVLNEFKVNMEGFKFTMQHVDKSVNELNTKMEKQNEKIATIQREKRA